MSEALSEINGREKPIWMWTYLIRPLFILCLVSGVFLLVYYGPAFTQAFSSVRLIEEQIPFGWLARRLHGVSAGFLIFSVLFELGKVFYTGAYKSFLPQYWVLKVTLLFCLIFGYFTGSFLPLSQESFWSTASSLANLATIPVVGNYLVNFLRGGQELGGAALSRFFSLHIGLAAAIAFLLFWKKGKEAKVSPGGILSGWNLGIVFVLWGLLCYFITWGPPWFVDELKEPAQPLLTPRHFPYPWFFLGFSEIMPFIQSSYPFFSFLLFWGVISIIFFLPYLDRNSERRILQRPISLALSSAFLVTLGYFSFLGIDGSKGSEMVVLPSAPQTIAEIRGARIYAERNCAFCHQINGRYGRREGPDMLVVGERKRRPEWIQKFIWNASLFQPGTTMPRYDLPLADLEALSAYLLSLHRSKQEGQVMPLELFRELEERVWLAKKEER